LFTAAATIARVSPAPERRPDAGRVAHDDVRESWRSCEGSTITSHSAPTPVFTP